MAVELGDVPSNAAGWHPGTLSQPAQGLGSMPAECAGVHISVTEYDLGMPVEVVLNLEDWASYQGSDEAVNQANRERMLSGAGLT